MQKPKKNKKTSLRISPRAEISAGAEFRGGSASITKPLASKGYLANVDVSTKKGVDVGGSYDTERKSLGLRGSYTTPKGGSISASKMGKYYSASYTSPKGLTVSADTEKNIDIDVPAKKGSGGASISPSMVSARYTTKKGIPIEASYEKEGKKFNIGTRIALNRKK